MKTVCAGLHDVAQARKPLIISIAAGIRIVQLDAWLGGNLPIVRCMPNTPAAIGKGMMVVYAKANVSAESRAFVHTLLSASGAVAEITDEGLMDAVTAALDELGRRLPSLSQ